MRIFLRGPLIPITRRRRCLPKAHRTPHPRTPDARSCRVSERDRAGAFPPRSCEGTVRGIAHQVKPDGRLRCAREDDGVPEKILMAPCRASIPLPFPTSAGKPGAPRYGGRAGTRYRVWCARRGSGDVLRATKSTMNPISVVDQMVNIRYSRLCRGSTTIARRGRSWARWRGRGAERIPPRLESARGANESAARETRNPGGTACIRCAR